MITPCPKHVECPEGTGTESPGYNYSSEHHDVPPYNGIYHPPTDYGTFTACRGRCVSLVSQLDADLCAKRNADVCMAKNGGPGPDHGNTDKPKPTIGNDPQACTTPNTGRTVIVPADVFFSDSKEQANALALSYANKLQVDGNQPPGVTSLPTPGSGTTVIPVPGPFPKPTQPTKKPTPSPGNHCPPCDDSAAIDTFVINANLPAGVAYQLWETDHPLKCGEWKFEVTGGPFDPASPQAFIAMDMVAGDPARSTLSWSGFFDCPQPAWVTPCGPGVMCDPATTQQFGIFPGCCDTTSFNCKYADCVTLDDGSKWLMVARVQYVCMAPSPTARNFVFTGTWLGPIPGSP